MKKLVKLLKMYLKVIFIFWALDGITESSHNILKRIIDKRNGASKEYLEKNYPMTFVVFDVFKRLYSICKDIVSFARGA